MDLDSFNILSGFQLLSTSKSIASIGSPIYIVFLVLIAILFIVLLFSTISLKNILSSILKDRFSSQKNLKEEKIQEYINTFNSKQIDKFLAYRKKIREKSNLTK